MHLMEAQSHNGNTSKGQALCAVQQKLTILFCALSVFDEFGGMQRFNQRIIKATQEDSGQEIGQIAVISLYDGEPRQLGDAVTFVSCGGSRLRCVIEFFRAIVQRRPDVILLGHVNVLPLALLKFFGAPSAITAMFVHGLEVWNDRAFGLRRFYERLLIRCLVDRIISVSRFTAEAMARDLRLRSLPVVILPNALDVDPSGQDFLRHCIAIDRPIRLLSVTRLAEQYKGIDKVVGVLPSLRASRSKIEYHIVGDGPLKANLIEQARALGVDGMVRFHGEVADRELESYYRSADIFVLPSQREGFGIVFLEAWKHGLPVICGGVDASPEVVIDGQSGIVIDPDDSVALVRAIERLIADPNYRVRLARNGFARLCENYSHSVFADTYRAILADLVGSAKRPCQHLGGA